MIIKPYIPKQKFNKLKVGDTIRLGENGHKFIIHRLSITSKTVMVKGVEGYWWKCQMFYIDMER